MRRRWIAFFALLKEAGLKWHTDNCLRLAASLSYYTLFSLFPLILVVLAITQIVLSSSDTARGLILDALARVTGGFRDEFLQTLTAAQKTRNATGIIGAATLLLGASWVFGELVSVFNIIWGLEPPERGGPLYFLRSTLTSFALVLAAAFLLLISMIVNALLTAVGDYMLTLPGGTVVWSLAHGVLSLVVLTLLFALLLRHLPQTSVAWEDVWLGAALTATLWTILQAGIAFYIAWSSYKDYGAIGAILALIVWVYLSAQVLFLGGEFTNCYARRYGSHRGLATGE